MLFLSPVHPFLTSANPLPGWQMQASWVRGLEKIGAEVKVVRYTPEGRIRPNWIERILQNIRVIREIWTIRGIDLIIYSLGADVLLPQTLSFIKWLTKAPFVILSGVSPVSDGNPRERVMAKLVDLAVVNDDGHAQEWRKLGVKKAVVLPISGMDPELHWRRGEEARRIVKKKKEREKREKRRCKDREIDVLFVGTLTPERKAFCVKLKNLLPKSINFVIAEFVWEEKYAKLMSRAKIVLNPIRPEMKHGANLRMFEIPAFGALESASYGNEKWLAPGKEMLVYRDAEEAAELIVENLMNGKRRKEMIERGQRRVLLEHTFENRAERLMELINPLIH